ncbi:MAG TPA: dihydropyrimidinase [Candidatus Dormibacteraeota bacterium]|nr:dihydropyrimidinase [Candidatus Dormibacteraeota bacterium]
MRGGTLVDGDGERQVDIVVRDGRVAAHLPAGESTDVDPDTIDASGLYVLPGVVDPHTHFSLDTGSGRTADDFVSGSGSAAAGGVTTYINFATQHPGEDFGQALAAVRREADGASLIDYSLHLNITRLDQGWERDLERAVDTGVTSAKVYTTYKDAVFYVDDHLILRLLERSGAAGLLVQVHAENDDLLAGARRELLAEGKRSFAYHSAARPAVAESEAVNRCLFFSRVTGSPVYFVHLSSPLSVDLVSEARERGIPALAETCPHFLCLDDSVYTGPDAIRFLMTPPIRSAQMREGLWERVERGAIQSVGSDHCGYSLEQRGGSDDFTTVSPGIPGVETTLTLLYTFGVEAGRIGMADLVRLLSENPARIFGLYPRKGNLSIGADADLVLFDPHAEGRLADSDLHSAAGFSPYSGLDLKGRVRTTVSRGRVVYDRGRVVGEPGWGRFVERLPYSAQRIFDSPGTPK